MPLGKEFPSAADLHRVKLEHELYCLFACKDIDPDKTSDLARFRLKEFFESDIQKSKILDIALNVAPVIVESGTDFIFGEPPKIEIVGADGKESATAGKAGAEIIKRNALVRKLSESCDLLQAVGHTHFKIYTQDGKAHIEEVPYSCFFPDYSDVPMGGESKNPRIAVYLNSTDDKGNPKKYIYVEDYFLKEKVVYIGYSLWEDIGGKIGTQVPLSVLSLDAGKENAQLDGLTLIQKTDLDELPIVKVDLRKTVNDRYGRSTLDRVKPLLRELNDRVTQLSLQFLKHLNAKMQIPDGTVARDKNGKIVAQNLEVILAQQGDPDAKYITNENPLIEQAFTHIEKIIRKICKLTATPDTFLTEGEKGGVEKVEALKVQLMQFFKRERFLQTIYEEAIRKILLLALKAEKVSIDGIDIKTTFDAGLPKDWEVDAKVWGDAKIAGLASRETAVSRFQGIEGDALAEEMAKIDADEKKMQESLLAMSGDDEDDDGDEE